MGICGEICADKYRILREEQVEVSGGRGKPSTTIDKDEGLEKRIIAGLTFPERFILILAYDKKHSVAPPLCFQFDAARLRKLRPSFKENGGSVTAGNASSISDGAAALVLVSRKKALELGLNVIAKIKGYTDAAQAPELFATAPALAIPKAISHTGLDAGQIDYYEINEAFSVVALSNQKLLGLKPDRVNVHGGAVSLGHPIGCSGARILITLLGLSIRPNSLDVSDFHRFCDKRGGSMVLGPFAMGRRGICRSG